MVALSQIYLNYWERFYQPDVKIVCILETIRLWQLYNTISLSCHEQVCLSGLRFERYFSHHRARWWEKYLSKRSPLKHTCSWHDKLIAFWILNRQAKISLRTWQLSRLSLYISCLDSPSHSLNKRVVRKALSFSTVLVNIWLPFKLA